MSNISIELNVDTLIYVTAMSGDIDNTFKRGKGINEGQARINIKNEYDCKYDINVELKTAITCRNFDINLKGTADGIIHGSNNDTIDSIIFTDKRVKDGDIIDKSKLYKSMCVAYIFAKNNNLDNIWVKQTHYNTRNHGINYTTRQYTTEVLEQMLYELLEKYCDYIQMQIEWRELRDKTIKGLEFPFKAYRMGQRELAARVYRSIRDSHNLFVQAPTGVGKTISTLFPAIKAIGENCISKIFYVTAKTITRKVAEESIDNMRMRGLALKTLTLTAKDKICFKENTMCSPEYCEYAKGYYDRVHEAIKDIYTQKASFTREDIEECARKHCICPFEFSLDLSLLADCIICDYNYVFDPQVYLRRYFESITEKYTFLVDEAHNLIDRSRDMFSAQLETKQLSMLMNLFEDKQSNVSNIIRRLKNEIAEKHYWCEKHDTCEITSSPDSIIECLKDSVDTAENWLTQHKFFEDGYAELLEFYFDAAEFIQKAANYEYGYTTYFEKLSADNVLARLMCIDTSYLMKDAISRSSSSILFSATLEPLDYYADLLGGGKEDDKIAIPSPFDPRHMDILIYNTVSTKYKYREDSYKVIVNCIKTLIEAKKGNYLVFFPSYKYMNDVYEEFTKAYPHINTLKQRTNMKEHEREEFINNFQPGLEETLVGFALLGGIFSEGLDLKGDKLVGAVIVGVGIPQICAERDIIKEYFSEKNGLGYEYSYTYPGMNKVLQAAGRVIRSEEDRGIILLLDDRFDTSKYRQLFPRHWGLNKTISNIEQLRTEVQGFWR